MYTVVIAVRPNDKFILEALGSIASQTLAAKRTLVVVNGGSLSDGNVARDVSIHFPAAELHQVDAPGMVPAFRHSLALCDTELVAFLDSDDLWVPEKAEIQARLLEKFPYTDAVYGITDNFLNPDYVATAPTKALAARLFSATTFRMRAFEKNGYPDVTATHFNWLYRWWAKAEKTGVVARNHNDLVLRRRISNESNWVSNDAYGKRVLLAELRSQLRNNPAG